MKKGFSTLNFLIGFLLSLYVLNLLTLSIYQLKSVEYKNYNQDILSSLQLMQIFNVASDINVSTKEVKFNYLNEARRLRFHNHKIILSPGTVIYFMDVDDCQFIEDDAYLKIYIQRKEEKYKYRIAKYE